MMLNISGEKRMSANNIYSIGANLGLSKEDIDLVLSSKNETTDYSDVSPKELYKAGTDYGTISPKEVYKAGTIYGTVSPKEMYKAGTIYGTISPEEIK